MIAGHESVTYVGYKRHILCKWEGAENITKLEWYLVGLEGLGLGMRLSHNVYLLNPGRVTDLSWNGKKFICKVTLIGGRIVTKTISLWVKGHYTKILQFNLDNNVYYVFSCVIYFYILDFFHAINITASKHKFKPYSSTFTLTCNVSCELPVTVKWVYNENRVVNTSTITVLEKIHLWNTTISIIFNTLLTSHEGTYKCLSSVQNNIMDQNFFKNQEYSLNVTGEAMQISISFSFNLFLKRIYMGVCKIIIQIFCHYKNKSISLLRNSKLKINVKTQTYMYA